MTAMSCSTPSARARSHSRYRGSPAPCPPGQTRTKQGTCRESRLDRVRGNIALVSGLIERFQAGDPDAIRALYREFGGAVHTVAHSIVRNRESAADVVQQTF